MAMNWLTALFRGYTTGSTEDMTKVKKKNPRAGLARVTRKALTTAETQERIAQPPRFRFMYDKVDPYMAAQLDALIKGRGLEDLVEKIDHSKVRIVGAQRRHLPQGIRDGMYDHASGLSLVAPKPGTIIHEELHRFFELGVFADVPREQRKRVNAFRELPFFLEAVITGDYRGARAALAGEAYSKDQGEAFTLLWNQYLHVGLDVAREIVPLVERIKTRKDWQVWLSNKRQFSTKKPKLTFPGRMGEYAREAQGKSAAGQRGVIRKFAQREFAMSPDLARWVAGQYVSLDDFRTDLSPNGRKRRAIENHGLIVSGLMFYAGQSFAQASRTAEKRIVDGNDIEIARNVTDFHAQEALAQCYEYGEFGTMSRLAAQLYTMPKSGSRLLGTWNDKLYQFVREVGDYNPNVSRAVLKKWMNDSDFRMFLENRNGIGYLRKINAINGSAITSRALEHMLSLDYSSSGPRGDGPMLKAGKQFHRTNCEEELFSGINPRYELAVQQALPYLLATEVAFMLYVSADPSRLVKGSDQEARARQALQGHRGVFPETHTRLETIAIPESGLGSYSSAYALMFDGPLARRYGNSGDIYGIGPWVIQEAARKSGKFEDNVVSVARDTYNQMAKLLQRDSRR